MRFAWRVRRAEGMQGGAWRCAINVCASQMSWCGTKRPTQSLLERSGENYIWRRANGADGGSPPLWPWVPAGRFLSGLCNVEAVDAEGVGSASSFVAKFSGVGHRGDLFGSTVTLRMRWFNIEKLIIDNCRSSVSADRRYMG